MSTSQMTDSGMLYSPNATGKQYICLKYHRDGSHNKSQWAVTPPTEHSMFCAADNHGWQLPDGHLWGLLNMGETDIGTRRERVAKFLRPNNAPDPWHGYPVSNNAEALQKNEATTQELMDAVQMLLQAEAIEPITAKRIRNGKL